MEKEEATFLFHSLASAQLFLGADSFDKRDYPTFYPLYPTLLFRIQVFLRSKNHENQRSKPHTHQHTMASKGSCHFVCIQWLSISTGSSLCYRVSCLYLFPLSHCVCVLLSTPLHFSPSSHTFCWNLHYTEEKQADAKKKEEEISELREAFNALDRESTGSIDHKDIGETVLK